jgi:hypothetical protein
MWFYKWINTKNLEVKHLELFKSMIQIFIHAGSQYGAIVVGAASGNFSDIGPRVLLEPVIGLGTSYQFIKAAQTVAERKLRIATLAAFLGTSVGSSLTTDRQQMRR